MTSRGLWLRWSWRDLRGRWLQVAAIALVIAIGSGTYAGLSSTARWRQLSYDDSYDTLRSHDLIVTLAEGTTVDAERLRSALTRVSHPEWYTASTVRLVAPTQVDASTEVDTILVPGRVVGVETTVDGQPPLDQIFVREGTPFADIDEGQVVLDEHFLDHHDLPPEGQLMLSGGRTVDYVGAGLSPQYFIVNGPTGSFFGAAGFAVMWSTIGTAQQISGQLGAANEAALAVAEGTDVEQARLELAQSLEAELPEAATTVTALADEREYQMLYRDIEGDQRLYDIFAVLIMAGAAFAAFNLTGRIVEAQRREIGIGMSLGVSRGMLAVRPLVMAAQIALIGVVLGVGVGLVIGQLMAGIIAEFFPLPVWETPFQPLVFVRGAVLGFLLTFAATIYPVWRAVRVTPIEAIQTGPRTTAGGGLARFVRRVRLPGRSVGQMPVRNVARAPRRTLLTAFGIAAAIATLIGVIGMLDSFLAAVDRGETELLREDSDRLSVSLQTFTLDSSPEIQALSTASGVDEVVPFLRIGGEVANGDERFEVLLDMLPFASAIWAPSVVQGTLASDAPALVISEKAARDLGVGVGETVTLRYPLREGLGYRWEEGPIPVAGIHPNPYRFVAFMDIGHADLMNLEGIVNAAQVRPAAGVSTTDAQRSLFDLPQVAAVEPISDVIQTIRDLVNQFADVLNLIRVVVLVLAVLIAFNSSSISSDERRREHATMFAFGLPTRAVVTVAMVESAIVGVIATVIGVVAGLGLLTWMTRVLLPTTLPDLDVVVDVQPSTYLTAAVLGVVAVSLAPLLTLRRLRRMNIPATLRVVE
jgi:putative ABC transport system permease protein